MTRPYDVSVLNWTPVEDRQDGFSGSKLYDENVTVDIGEWPEFGLRHQRMTIACTSGIIRVFWVQDDGDTNSDVGEFTLQAGEDFTKNFGLSRAYPDYIRVEEDDGSTADYVLRLDKQ